jgi:hypothetical protein
MLEAAMSEPQYKTLEQTLLKARHALTLIHEICVSGDIEFDGQLVAALAAGALEAREALYYTKALPGAVLALPVPDDDDSGTLAEVEDLIRTKLAKFVQQGEQPIGGAR